VVPITDEMKTGKVPLRSFGDLLQFYELKHEEPDGQPPAQPPTPESAAKKSEISETPVAAEQQTPVAAEQPTAAPKDDESAAGSS